MKKLKILIAIIFAGIFNLQSQELPPINLFTPKEYSAENQNWSISQAQNNFIYVANNKGLLEYNGAKWHLYPSPNETIFRSVKVFNKKIYTGFFMDFGFWEKNNFGSLEYTSIVKAENIQMLEDEQIWNILELDGWMIFKSLQRIYLYHLESKVSKIINVENRITKIAKVEGVIYFQEINKGVFKIENGAAKLISNNLILKENILVDMFNKEGKLLLLTQDNGFFFLENGLVSKWEISSNAILENLKVYSAKQLKNNDFVLGTISDGMINLDNKGNLNYQIKQNSGLANNTVLCIFEDVDNNLWLGLDNGISCVNNVSPFRIYNEKNDFLGTVYTSIVFNDYLYLGTNQGVFYKKIDSDLPFEFIEKTAGQVWSLLEIDGTLFCGHDSGAFYIKNHIANKISKAQGVWDLKMVDKNTIIQGSYDGLYVLKKRNGLWEVNNKIEGFNNSSRYFVLVDNNKIFVNHEYKGVFKLVVDDNYENFIKVEKEKSVDKGIYSSLINYKKRIFYASKEGVYVYKQGKDLFVKDTVFSALISEENFTSGKLIYNASNDMLWSFSEDNIKYLTPGILSKEPIIRSIPILESLRKGASGFENIIHFKNKKQLIGTSNSYLTVDLSGLKEPKDFNISINAINSFELDKPKKPIYLGREIVFENKENNIEFHYSVTNYSKMMTTKYQYQLLGQNKHWSVPSESNSILFENIPYGTYTFRVRGIIGNKISKNVENFSFEIEKPWYLSNLMIAFYILSISLVLYVFHITSKKYYKKQRESLLEKAKKDSALKELESSQKIVRLNNDKLRNDIENKNRELATSTMNIINKNKFLNTIKTRLITGGEKNIDRVIHIIDKNLNNTDDWEMFQEAFNNADKKFLKKVKSKHPDLTPNDLRLCAYLRLNLSSKEIAPMLNISTRSVEVKRYRLRKKMNLDHNSNLTNYILEI